MEVEKSSLDTRLLLEDSAPKLYRVPLEGQAILYELCRKYNLVHRQVGKLIVAVDDNEVDQLEALLNKGEKNVLARYLVYPLRQPLCFSFFPTSVVF